MHIKIFLKKLISIIVVAFMATTLVGCFDLGDFDDESDYYASFGDVRLVYNVAEKISYKDYSIKDYFYNKNTGEDFAYGDPKDEEPDIDKDIPQLAYAYMAIPIKQDFSIESFALYINATNTSSMQIYVYLVNELPDNGSFSKIRLLGDPEYQQKLDDKGNPMEDGDGNPIYQEKLDENNNLVYDENGNLMYEPAVYSDPDDSKIVATISTHTTQGKWSSFMVKNWNSGKTLSVKKSQYLLLRFVNNGGLASKESSVVNFRMTNLLVRAFSK